jgi:transposase
VPASTQWDIAYPVFETAVHPYEELVRQAAQGELFHIDDTGVKILSIMKENKEKKAVKEGAADWKKRKATSENLTWEICA